MPTTKSKVTTRSQTLHQFSSDIDDHLGRAVGFEPTVMALYDVRQRIKLVEDRRQTAYRALEDYQRRGGALIPMAGGVQKVLVRRKQSIKHVKVVPAAAVKKADKAAYERAKSLRDWVAVKAPTQYQLVGEAPKLPPVPHAYMDAAAVVALYQSPAYQVLGELRETEAAVKNDLSKIAADCGWDGTEETFSDGWAVQLKTLRYDSDRLKTIDPALWDQLAVVTERKYGGQLAVLDYDMAVNLGYVDDGSFELDEIDGD